MTAKAWSWMEMYSVGQNGDAEKLTRVREDDLDEEGLWRRLKADIDFGLRKA